MGAAWDPDLGIMGVAVNIFQKLYVVLKIVKIDNLL
jgi:hypothetical protein